MRAFGSSLPNASTGDYCFSRNGEYCFGSDKWLPGSGESMGEGPCIELYRHAQRDGPPPKVVTDLCVSLREQLTCE